MKLNFAKKKDNAIFEINNLKKANENLVKKVHSLYQKQHQKYSLVKGLVLKPTKSRTTKLFKLTGGLKRIFLSTLKNITEKLQNLKPTSQFMNQPYKAEGRRLSQLLI